VDRFDSGENPQPPRGLLRSGWSSGETIHAEVCAAGYVPARATAAAAYAAAPATAAAAVSEFVVRGAVPPADGGHRWLSAGPVSDARVPVAAAVCPVAAVLSGTVYPDRAAASASAGIAPAAVPAPLERSGSAG